MRETLSVDKDVVILVVDDEAFVLRFMLHILRDAGFSVLGARSINEAMRVCRDKPPDLVITDLKLGRSNEGNDLIAWLKENCPGVPCMLMTGYSVDDKDSCDVIYKPFTPAQVVARIRQKLSSNA